MTNADTYKSVKERYKLILCNVLGVRGRHYSGRDIVYPLRWILRFRRKISSSSSMFDPESGMCFLGRLFSARKTALCQGLTENI
jgi:hypothetical protein